MGWLRWLLRIFALGGQLVSEFGVLDCWDILLINQLIVFWLKKTLFDYRIGRRTKMLAL